MEVVPIELVVALLTVALDIGLVALDRAMCTGIELCSWRSIVVAIISSESSLISSSDKDLMTSL
jgi:hypothetical protein